MLNQFSVEKNWSLRPIEKLTKPIATKFCKPGAVQDVITHSNFCDERLMDFRLAAVTWKMLYLNNDPNPKYNICPHT